MRRTKAFTLVELLVVISIIALLVSILMPSLSRAQELARRVNCAANLKNIGTALQMYTAETTSGNWPWMDNSGSWQDDTGTNKETAPSDSVAHSITALPFLLVRDGQDAKLFICPSDKGVLEDKETMHDESGKKVYNWDFSEDKNISYSYQAPLVIGGNYKSGAGAAADSLIIMADKTPSYDDKTATTAWADTMDEQDMRDGMSQNHSEGEVINALRQGGSVTKEVRADIGIEDDNIYSSATGDNDTLRSGGSESLDDHDSARDSFLIGPFPYQNP